MSETSTNITPSPAPGPMATTTTIVGSPLDPDQRRLVDLGREEARVPWAQWFNRASAGMDLFMEQGIMPKLPRAFRVTLRDGRPYAVFSVKTHIARGKCSASGRWAEPTECTNAADICDVITGYSLVGTAHDGRPVVLTVPPDEIASVECVLVQGHPGQATPEEGASDEVPFGFAAFAKRGERPQLDEVEEETPFTSVI